MTHGKQICKTLKEIRHQIAQANDIDFITSPCTFEGDCTGTCPRCEAELQYIEQQLNLRRAAGKVITLLGISTCILPMNAPPQTASSGTRQHSYRNHTAHAPMETGYPTRKGNPCEIYNSRTFQSPFLRATTLKSYFLRYLYREASILVSSANDTCIDASRYK